MRTSAKLLRPASLAGIGLVASLALYVAVGYSHLAVLLVTLLTAAWLFGPSLELLLSGGLAVACYVVAARPLGSAGSVQGAVDLAALLLTVVVLAVLSRRSSTALDEATSLNRALASELETRSDVWSGAAHDLKHPLAVINLRADLLERRLAQLDLNDDFTRDVKEIRGTANEMRELIDELQDAATLQHGLDLELIREPTDLVALAAHFTATSCARTGRNIRMEASTNQVWGRWDRARIGRVLTNVISNGLKYSPPDSEVVVTVGQEEGWAVLRVTDHGIGIPEAELEQVFERFYRGANVRRKVYGTGLGLAGSRSIVEQHGGLIGVQSREGAGSTFTVRLPLDTGEAAGPEPALEDALAILTEAERRELPAAPPRTSVQPLL